MARKSAKDGAHLGELDAARAELEETKDDLDATRAELDATRAELEATRAALLEMGEKLTAEQKQVALIRQAHAEAAAEFGRTRDRLVRDQGLELERARHQISTRLFEVADNLERTLEAAMGGSAEGLLDGVQLVRDQFFRELATFGLECFSPEGEPFDPSFHEAIGITRVADPSLADRVVHVFQPGFRAGAHVLRAAVVQVGRYEPPPEPQVVDANEAAAMADATPSGDEEQ